MSPDTIQLKGGFALQLRLVDSARATKDIDIAWLSDKTELGDALLDATTHDASDFFHYRIERDAAPEDRLGGSYRFRVTVELAGRSFDRFVVDVGFDYDLTGETEVVTTSDALSFAGIPPASINAIVLERHLAEKTHAYTRERTGSRQNTRVKDLVDMVLVAKHFPLDGSSFERSVTRTFSARGAHPTPVELPPPPTGWAVPFARLATEVDIPVEIGPAYALATSLVNPVLAGSVRGSRWDPVSTTWKRN